MKDGKPVFSDAIANDPEGRSPFIMQTTFSPISGVGFPCVYYSEAVNQLENQEVVAVRNAMDKYRQDTLDFVLPDLPFTNEDNAQIRSIMGEVNTYVDETLASFIFGGESFSKWDEFVANVKKMDVEKLIDVYQKAYDNYKK
jgi:putative aldouronate transport system substrate-binding protein